MEKNKFILEPSTAEVIDKSSINPGHGTIDCNYERVYSDIKNSSTNYDHSNDRPIIKSEFVYLPDFPSKVIDYDGMMRYGKDKYYWDALGQNLYKFKVTSEVKPFVAQRQTIYGCESDPATGGVSVDIEFTKRDGIWKEVFPDHAISDYILIKGHPQQYAKRPYVENTYYFDITNNKYYFFISNYTRNINNWYYNRMLDECDVLKFIYKSEKEIEGTNITEVTGSWAIVNQAMVLSGNPNDLIKVIDKDMVAQGNYTTVDVDDINKTICYCDRITDTLYYFDYGQYFERILYSGVVYERPFEFYRKLQDVFLDINPLSKILTKDIFYISGHPKKVKKPKEGRYYYDTRGQKYYKYINNSWSELLQENIIIPQSYFPHTNGPIIKLVTLSYYNIVDCYTKKEFDSLIPVVPKYISAFENDAGYFNTHQDLSGKQDKLNATQMAALNSGITSSIMPTFDRFSSLVESKASRSNLESCLVNLTDRFNNA